MVWKSKMSSHQAWNLLEKASEFWSGDLAAALDRVREEANDLDKDVEKAQDEAGNLRDEISLLRKALAYVDVDGELV